MSRPIQWIVVTGVMTWIVAATLAVTSVGQQSQKTQKSILRPAETVSTSPAMFHFSSAAGDDLHARRAFGNELSEGA
jgi:ABC-type phosphate transport system permease subunit